MSTSKVNSRVKGERGRRQPIPVSALSIEDQQMKMENRRAQSGGGDSEGKKKMETAESGGRREQSGEHWQWQWAARVAAARTAARIAIGGEVRWEKKRPEGGGGKKRREDGSDSSKGKGNKLEPWTQVWCGTGDSVVHC